MEEEYKEIIKEFYGLYALLSREYNVRIHTKFSMSSDGLIEAWKYEGERRGECICRIREKEDIDCYKKATRILQRYKKEREEEEYERSAAMAI